MTAAPAAPAMTAHAPSRPSAMRLMGVHLKANLLATVRIPIALVGTILFPLLIAVFFILPNVESHIDAVFSTGAILTFVTMISALFGLGVGISEERALPWDGFVRSLPAGAVPRFTASILATLTTTMAGIIPVGVLMLVASPAEPSGTELALGLAGLVAASLPFSLLGLAIGYSMPVKAAIAVTQIVFFPLGYVGGLFMPPQILPDIVQTISPYTPTRGAVEIVWAGLVGPHTPDPTALAMYAMWVVVFGALAVLAFRRDEGRRYR